MQGWPLLAARAPASTGPWPGAGCQGRPCAGRLDGWAGVEGGCLRSRAAGQPAPPASGRWGWAVGHRPGPRARSCRSSPPAGPGCPPGHAPPPGHLLSRPVCPPGPCLLLPGAAVPSGLSVRGADLTGRAEASVRRRGPTDGPRTGTHTAPARPAATPGGAPGTADDPLLTIEEVTSELRVSRAAFYRWRRQGAGPAVVRLPGGGVRVRRSALTAWLRHLEDDTQDGQEHTADG
jgi:excisionase family DNA binding protein